MSDLQIGLLILGLFIVGCVIAFNWIQERQFHQRSENGFKRPSADLLLDPKANQRAKDNPEERIDPSFEPQFEESGAPVVREEQQTTQPEETGSNEAAVDASIAYVAEIRSGEVVPAPMLDALTQALSEVGRRYQLSGYDYHTHKWEPVSDPEHWYTSIRVSFQLVDRTGRVTREELEQVAALLRGHADAISAIAELPDIENVLSNAVTLDEFCVDVDVIVGLSVIARSGQVLHGTQLRALAESNGLHLDSNGVFVLQDANGDALFTMDNQESKPFRAEELKEFVTQGVTFLLDVPRTGDGLKVFNKMVTTCRQFADSLDGTLCDDNRVMLNDSGLEKIRSKLRSIYGIMEQRGIPAGSEPARNLFS
jgi:FtsZ-interacting cell division protein ZipA